MHRPFLVTSTILFFPFDNLTSINSSSSFNVIAINPVFLSVLYSFNGVFFTNPFLVFIIKYSASAKLFNGITAAIFSPGSNCSKLTIAVPFAVLPASGISNPRSLYSLPLFVKNKIISCVDALNICFTKSSSRVVNPEIPLPPRLWLLYVSTGILLIYPKCVNVIIEFSSSIKSSSSNSPSALTIFVNLSSPYFSIISSDSSLIKLNTNFSSAKIALKCSINFNKFWYSSSIFSLCNPDKVFNLISKIDCAWMSSSPNLFINCSFGSSYDPLITFITSSMLSIAILKPSKMWALANALSNSNSVLLIITSFLCSIKCSKHCLNVKILGSPFTNANMIVPNESCNCVYLYNLFSTICAFVSLFNSITTLTISSLSDSSLTSDMPSIFLSLANWFIAIIKLALFTWYGNDFIMIFWRFPDISSISASPLIIILPVPVKYASLIPSLPRINPPVGKSGPFTIFNNSSSLTWSSSINLMTAFNISVRLCGGILVAIPTAIPDDPFTNRAGNLVGSTVGSCLIPSKFGINLTVFFSISASIVSEIFDILASV